MGSQGRRRWRSLYLEIIFLLGLSLVKIQVLSLSTCRILEPTKIKASDRATLSLTSRRPIRLFSSEYDEDPIVKELEGDDDMIEDSLMASPLSQLRRSEDDESLYKVSFSRNEKWLDQATEEILDEENFAVGSLSVDDVESIVGLMAAWVRRRSVTAGMMVERLLKRVVDEMRVLNPDVHVTSRMYTLAIDAWAKSGTLAGAQRAQNIHDGMVEHYRRTKDPNVAPSSTSYNTLINAWCKCGDACPQKGEELLQEMLQWNNTRIRPDAVTFSTLLDSYAHTNMANATQHSERLFRMMDDLKVKRNVFTFSALQNVYARSGLPDAPEKAMEILQTMLDAQKAGDMFAKPNCVNYNAVLAAYSRTPSRKSAERADKMLTRMELPVEKGGYDVEPDRLSYALTILTCSRCPDRSYAPRIAERNLERMERKARHEAQKREEVSSAAPPSVILDVECFNVVLTAISKSAEKDAVQRAIRLVKRMEQYAEQGQESIRPNRRSWNAILNAVSRCKDKRIASRAEQIVNHMFKLSAQGIADVQPDAFSFAAVLSAYQRSGSAHFVQRADDILRQMEDLYESGELSTPPDVYHYTIVCAAWAKSKQKQAAHRCIQILTHMKERDAEGYPDVKPNVRTYNAVLDCLARSYEEDRAEQLLYHMLDLGRNGDMKSFPDSFSFRSVINAFTRSRKRDAGTRAESVLDRFLEYAEDHPSLQPDARSFTNIIAYYGRSNFMPDAPYRAEYILSRMISLYKAGHKNLAPNMFAFSTVMNSYSKQKHPDAGECAERLLRLLMKLRDFHGATKLEVNTGVMNCVLNAWASCGGDDAGRRSDMILQDMEFQCDNGNDAVRPNPKSYCLVLTAWSKSGSFDKAERALEVLERMKARSADGKLHERPGERAYSLVINACAFTKNSNPDADVAPFRIAVAVFKELVESDVLEPGSAACGWFIQACGRLQVSKELKEENIKRAFMTCCDHGLVNDFVFSWLKEAASDDLFRLLMSSGGVKVGKTDSKDQKERIKLFDLPKDWTKRRQKPYTG